MPRGAPSPGAVRRHCLAVHDRLKAEIAIRAAGHTLSGWRGNRPVIRVPARSKP